MEKFKFISMLILVGFKIHYVSFINQINSLPWFHYLEKLVFTKLREYTRFFKGCALSFDFGIDFQSFLIPFY